VIYIILFFIYGLVVGSFCNVVIHRLRVGEGVIAQGSHCPHCNTPIKWRDNVPLVGFMLLRGKCRSCKKKISVQYPLVELANGLLFMGVGYFYHSGSIDVLITAILIALALAGLSIIFVYDLKYMEVPMGVMWSVIGLLLLANGVMDLYDGLSGGVWESTTYFHALSAFVVFCFFFGLSYFSDETWMGYGDAFIAIAIGLLLGPFGSFFALLVAFCVGALGGIFLMFFKGKGLKSEIPFGPFLIFALYGTFFIQNLVPDLVDFFI
jgi:leader peptidase (prepilin peptidase) / N-methyltransferase